MADNNFYRAFEDRYRGSRDLIKSRLAVYLPFIQPLKKFYVNCPSIDLGCGRGEWLELMQEKEIDAQGVDLDQGMLEVARTRGLNVHLGDAIQYLQSLASDSQMLVSGFHLVEHLPFEALQILIQESHRVLKPGGLLILETPNAENITVGTEKFYLDPTHHRPIPSQFLSFMAEYAGFERIKVLRLQEPTELANEGTLILLSVLNGVSPDYAVVAQKGGASGVASATTTAFDADHGLSLESLANNYDRQIKTLIQQAAAKAQQAEVIAQQAAAKAQQAEVIAQQAEAKAVSQEHRAFAAESRVIDIQNSSSWKITAPLRMFSNAAKGIFHLPQAATSKGKVKIKLLLAHAKLYINRRPKLNRAAFAVLTQFPALKMRLIRENIITTHEQIAQSLGAIKLTNLTPRARRIYVDLKAAIKDRSKKSS